MIKTAAISNDLKYRYELTRVWDSSKPLVAFIGLNPSTADDKIDDPTIRRCIGFAKTWGFGGLIMGNIHALRSTDPKALYHSEDPTGIMNDAYLMSIKSRALITVAAWGVHGELQGRGEKVKKLLEYCYVLGLTKDGHPKHPLYLKKDLKPIAWK